MAATTARRASLPNDRYTFLPSFSAGWRISQEKFFESLRDYIGNLEDTRIMG